MTHKSTSGSALKFTRGVVLWKSKLQRCVALSSMEAKYVAASEMAKSMVWMDRLLKELGVINDEVKPVLYVDNQSAIKLIGNPEFHKCSKHIETRYHFLRSTTAIPEDQCGVHPNRKSGGGYLHEGIISRKAREDEDMLGIRKIQR